jgi:hypothetical protein
MPAKRLREECGYSLVEVMVSIMIMALAILPMIAMFDTGFRSATTGSNYDKARTLANLKLEQAKNLPFAGVESNFPEAGNATPFDSAWLTEPGADFANFRYRVEKDYMEQPCLDPDTGAPDPACASDNFDTSDTPTGLIRVTVTAGWEGVDDGTPDKTFTTSGLVAQ